MAATPPIRPPVTQQIPFSYVHPQTRSRAGHKVGATTYYVPPSRRTDLFPWRRPSVRGPPCLAERCRAWRPDPSSLRLYPGCFLQRCQKHERLRHKNVTTQLLNITIVPLQARSNLAKMPPANKQTVVDCAYAPRRDVFCDDRPVSAPTQQSDAAR